MTVFQRTSYRPQRRLSLDSLVFSCVLGTMLVVIVAGTVVETAGAADTTVSQTSGTQIAALRPLISAG